MFIRGYNHSLLKSPEQKPKWPKSFSNHPTSWKTTTLEAIHHIYIYTCTYKYIYIQSFQCLILTLKWKTWFLGYNAVLSLMVSSLNVSVPFVDWFYGCPRNKGWKLPTRTKQLRIGRHFWTFNDVFDFTFERCGTVHKSRKAFKARPYCNVSNRSVGNDKKKQSGEKTCRELPTE